MKVYLLCVRETGCETQVVGVFDEKEKAEKVISENPSQYVKWSDGVERNENFWIEDKELNIPKLVLME